ncbi:MAG: hypothetical protein JOZ37_15540 [Actinobacteria bacterium]|nr:hypothetical protein [Actinomycetota bacterium]MBV9665381.1 hypothetical protein [Actinomycetota bacterium]MBV9933401.1 hypothetical protein [Actinomycetota bacterium]
MPQTGWILRNERRLTLGVIVVAALVVAFAALVRYGPGPWNDSSSHTTTTLGLGESLGSTAETKTIAFPNGNAHPGALNRDVTQANIHSTICSTAWVARVTPPADFLERLERQQLSAEKKPGSVDDYAEDHLIPIELGGALRDAKNLWPQPYESKGARFAPIGSGAESKDKVERKLHDKVCNGALTLKLARQAIAGNWQVAGAQL